MTIKVDISSLTLEEATNLHSFLLKFYEVNQHIPINIEYKGGVEVDADVL